MSAMHCVFGVLLYEVRGFKYPCGGTYGGTRAVLQGSLRGETFIGSQQLDMYSR